MVSRFTDKYLRLCVEEMGTDGRTMYGREVRKQRAAMLASASDLDLKYMVVHLQNVIKNESLDDIHQRLLKVRQEFRQRQYIG